MKKRLLFSIFVTLLAGCSSNPMDLRKNHPIATYTSKKDNQAVAECIMFSWQAQKYGHGIANIQKRPRQGLTVVHPPLSVMLENCPAIADVYPDKQLTKVDFYWDDLWTNKWVAKKLIQSINSCL
jgi:starvation-inducible outer membrane lipoprotein